MATRADEALPAATADNLPWGRGRGLGDGLVRVAAPLLVGALILLAWELVVRVNEIPHYILPAPSLVWAELLTSWPTLWPSLLVTLQIAGLPCDRPKIRERDAHAHLVTYLLVNG